MRPETDGVVVDASRPLTAIEVVDADGLPAVRRTLVEPTHTIALRVPLLPGPHTVRLRAGEDTLEQAFVVPDRGPVDVQIQAPIGQEPVSTGAVVALPDGRPVRVGVVVDAREPLVVPNSFGPALELQGGERRVLVTELGPDGLEGWLDVRGTRVPVVLAGETVATSVLREQLVVGEPRLPARGDGSVDRTAPVSRIQLPAPWWDAVLDRLGLGFRPRDDLAPRTHVALTLTNTRGRALQAVVSGQVHVDGLPHEAFRVRHREATDLSEVRRLVRVPPGASVDVALPVYLDRTLVPEGVVAEAVLQVSTLGAPEPLHTVRAPFVVERGHRWATWLFVAGLLSAFAGLVQLVVSLGRWLERPTRELTTIAVFGALSFVVGTTSQVVGLGLASVLGPFAPFVMGFADDALRICLIATLLTLVPRAGVVSLALVLGWLMRAVALGAAHPVDLLYIGASVFWFELGVRVTGLSSGRVDGLRLLAGFVLPNALLTGFGLAVSVILYRLFYADLYVLGLVLGPGLIYPALGCLFAVPFARSLRRVAP